MFNNAVYYHYAKNTLDEKFSHCSGKATLAVWQLWPHGITGRRAAANNFTSLVCGAVDNTVYVPFFTAL
jgi:hypothetical protein